jgi:SAM-dependent methyltransferase
VQVSKGLDEAWQSAVSSLYESTRAVLADEFGYDLFITYGTLLGAVREGGFLAHDNDYDASFVSSATTGPEAADELVEIAKVLIAKGYRVGAMGGGLHVIDPARPDHRIDIFHIYFDADGVLQHPFGYAGRTQITTADWKGTREIEFVGRPALIPVCAEKLLATFYGDDWRLPKTAFKWNVEKRGNDRTGVMTPSRLTDVYWADYYAHHDHADASSFARFVHDRLGSDPVTVVDIGCGDGRDSIYFATRGRKVLGLDRASGAIEHAREKADQAGLARARFEVCDLADGAALASVLSEEDDRPLVFYSRFVLHAIDARTQAAVQDAMDAQSRSGDLFVAEFRTDKDEELVKAHPKHFRRYQNAAGFLADLRERGWVIDYDIEASGLAPWGDEDPVLCRAIARRP